MELPAEEVAFQNNPESVDILGTEHSQECHDQHT